MLFRLALYSLTLPTVMWAICGCADKHGKQSAIEGQIIITNGGDISGVTIFAYQVEPIKGYEGAMAVTGKDGTFRLSGLFPSAEYRVYPSAPGLRGEIVAKSGPPGETSVRHLLQLDRVESKLTQTTERFIKARERYRASEKSMASMAKEKVELAISLIPSGTEKTFLLPDNTPMVMVWMRKGFETLGENRSNDWEAPRHMVSFPGGYWIGKYEVTQAQWKAVMGTNPSFFQGKVYGNTDNHPVESISWEMVAGSDGFLDRLNKISPDISFRLPSEAEWEYACRASSFSSFYWGPDWAPPKIADYAWFRENSGSQTHAVGGKLPNKWGLQDMSGNVAEWCQDCWHDDYTGAPTDGSAWVLPIGSARVIRGGSSIDGSDGCRSAARGACPPSFSSAALGFRLATSTVTADDAQVK